MKTRQSFVTNSSSSSYIVVIGEILDKEKVEINFPEAKIKKGSEFKYWELEIDWAGIYFNKKLLDPDKEYVYISESGDEPTWNEDTYEYDYDDVELDWFSKEAQELYSKMSKAYGVKEVYKGFGAGRDG